MRLHAIRPLQVTTFAGLAGLAGAGCGGAKGGPGAMPPAGQAAVSERPPGTTGLPGLDWGNGTGEITALHPDAAPVDVGLQARGEVEGKPAVTTYTLDGDGLAQVDIRWDVAFDSMDACGEALHQLRPAIDARLGEGGEENLAVFWDNQTVSVRLSCDPDDADQAQLSQTYQRKVAE